MKKLLKNPAYIILGLVFLIAFCTKLFAQPTVTPADLEQSFWQQLWNGFNSFISVINWLYVVCFILICWLVNDFSDSTNKAKWLGWLSNVPKILRACVIGILLIAIFFYLFDYHGRGDVKAMFFSLIASLTIFKFGIEKFLSIVSKKVFGLSFDKKDDQTPNVTTPKP